MSILSLDTSTVPSFLNYPAHAKCRALILRDLEMASAALGITNPPSQPGGEWDLLAGMFATTCDIQFSSLQLANAKGDVLFAEGEDLEELRRRFGVVELPPSGGAGRVLVQVTGPCVFVAGEQCVFPGGLRGAVSADTTFTSAGTGTVPVVMSDTGLATNFTPGTTCRWASPPANSFTTASVADDGTGKGFTGGLDTESDASKRYRILDAMHLPQLYGTLQWILAKVEEFPASQYPPSYVPDQMFAYRAPGGPGTFVVVVMQTGTAAGGWHRAVSSTTLASLRTYLSTLVPPEVHFDVRTVIEVPRDVTLTVAFTGAANAMRWKDAAPWPDLPGDGVTGYVTCTSINGANTLVGVNCPSAPTAGASFRICTSAGVFDYVVGSFSGVPGNYSVSATVPLHASVAAGCFIYPSTQSPSDSVEATWGKAMGTLACGELLVDARLPQCRRFPRVAFGGASPSVFAATANFGALLTGSVLNLQTNLGAGSPPNAAGVYSAPVVFTPGKFAVYRSPFS